MSQKTPGLTHKTKGLTQKLMVVWWLWNSHGGGYEGDGGLVRMIIKGIIVNFYWNTLSQLSWFSPLLCWTKIYKNWTLVLKRIAMVLQWHSMCSNVNQSGKVIWDSYNDPFLASTKEYFAYPFSCKISNLSSLFFQWF